MKAKILLFSTIFVSLSSLAMASTEGFSRHRPQSNPSNYQPSLIPQPSPDIAHQLQASVAITRRSQTRSPEDVAILAERKRAIIERQARLEAKRSPEQKMLEQKEQEIREYEHRQRLNNLNQIEQMGQANCPR